MHGQVTAGWFQVRHGAEHTGLALSFQILSTADRRRCRLVLNVLGRGPGGEPLEELYAGLGAIPWQPVVGWGQRRAPLHGDRARRARARPRVQLRGQAGDVDPDDAGVGRAELRRDLWHRATPEEIARLREKAAPAD